MDRDQQLLRNSQLAVRLLAALLVAVCLLAVLLVPKTLRMLAQMEQALTTVNELSTTASETLVTAGNALETADSLVSENAENISVAMEKFNSVDFDALNRAIGELADVIEPIAKIARLLP